MKLILLILLIWPATLLAQDPTNAMHALEAETVANANVRSIDYYSNNDMKEFRKYDSNGRLISIGFPAGTIRSKTYSYKKKGRRVLCEQFNADKKLIGTTEWNYSKSGACQTKHLTLSSGKRILQKQEDFDASGNLVKVVDYNDLGEIETSATKTYDANDRIVDASTYNAEGVLKKQFIYTYRDSVGEAYVTLKIWNAPYDPATEIGPFLWLTYNDAGQTTGEFENGHKLFSHYYDEAGNRIETIQWHVDVQERRMTYQYNNQGYLTQRITFDAKGEIFFKTTHTYSPEGLLVHSETRYPQVGKVLKERWHIQYFDH